MNRIPFWLARLVMLSVVLFLSASSPAWGVPARRPLGVSPSLGLPDLTIEFNEEGKVKLFSIPLWWIPGLDDVGLDPEIVARFANSNVQHIHLDYHSSGMVMLANGLPILDFRYKDQDQLWSILNGLSVFMGEQGGTMLASAQRFLPLMETIGMEIIAKFPVPENVPSIPTASDDSYTIPNESTMVRFEYGARSAGVESFEINVAADGSLTSGNFAFNLLQALVPADMDLKLPLETVENVSEAGIREVKVTNRHYGVVLELNGKDLPLLICYRDNLFAFADESDRWSKLAPKVEEEKVTLVRRVVQDVLLTTNVDITFHFSAVSMQGTE